MTTRNIDPLGIFQEEVATPRRLTSAQLRFLFATKYAKQKGLRPRLNKPNPSQPPYKAPSGEHIPRPIPLPGNRPGFITLDPSISTRWRISRKGVEAIGPEGNPIPLPTQEEFTLKRNSPWWRKVLNPFELITNDDLRRGAEAGFDILSWAAITVSTAGAATPLTLRTLGTTSAIARIGVTDLKVARFMEITGAGKGMIGPAELRTAALKGYRYWINPNTGQVMRITSWKMPYNLLNNAALKEKWATGSPRTRGKVIIERVLRELFPPKQGARGFGRITRGHYPSP